jgi:hypothetical protein
MTPHQIVGVGVRVFAAWLACHGVWRCLSAIQNGPVFEFSGYELRGVAIGALVMLVAAILWVGAAIAAKALIPKELPGGVSELGARSFARAFVVLLGLWLAVDSGRSLVWYLTREIVPWHDGDALNVSHVTTSHAADMISATIVGAVGLWMLFRPGVLAGRIVPRSDGDAGDC